jgi:AcrR family transcriptional regulator
MLVRVTKLDTAVKHALTGRPCIGVNDVMPSAGSRRRDAVEHREQILRAAREVFSEQPRAGLAAVGAASSLTRTTVYAHFSSREALLEALVERAMADGMAAWDARGPHTDPLVAIEDHLRGSWQALAGQVSLLQAATDALGPDRLAQLHGPLHQRVHAMLEAARAAEVIATDVPLPWQVRTWFALIHEAGRGRGVRAGRRVEGVLVVTVLRALGAVPQPAPAR